MLFTCKTNRIPVRIFLPDAEIWYGTYERPYLENIDTILNSPAGKFLSGIGFQWAGKKAIPLVHDKYPDMKLMQTESECGNGDNNWESAEYTWSLIKHYIENGASSYLYWNMVLDETGRSMWGWKQNSLISIDSSTGTITRNPEFYLFRHLSQYVKPGAKKLRTPKGMEDAIIFLNPGNQLVILGVNSDRKMRAFQLEVNGNFMAIRLLPGSFNTVLMDL